MELIKCVFFDRDGIVNRSPDAGYVERWEDFCLLPEFVESLRTARQAGYEAAIVTNQRGVARGIMSRETLESIHCLLRDELKRQKAPALLDIIYCPHNLTGCVCRKPQPGMLYALAARHRIQLSASWMIGDNETDAVAGKRAGCRAILVNAKKMDTRADYKIDRMARLPSLLNRILL